MGLFTSIATAVGGAVVKKVFGSSKDKKGDTSSKPEIDEALMSPITGGDEIVSAARGSPKAIAAKASGKGATLYSAYGEYPTPTQLAENVYERLRMND